MNVNNSLASLIKSKPIPVIDLFAGAGGMTLGFTSLSQGRFWPVWANDYNRYAVDTYNKNFGPHCVLGDLVDILTPQN